MLAAQTFARNVIRPFLTLSLAALSLAGANAAAQVALDTYSNPAQTIAAGTTSLSFNYVLGTGGNRLVVCTVAMSNPTTGQTQIVPMVSIGGIQMTAVAQAPGSSQNTPKIEDEMFWANDSTLSAISGNTQVAVTLPAAQSGGTVVGCSSFFGVAQSAPKSSGTFYNGSNVTGTVTLSGTAAGDLVIDTLGGGFTAAGTTTKSASPGTGQTQLYNLVVASGGVMGGSSYILATGTSTTVTWPNTLSRLTQSALDFAAAPTTNYTVSTAVSPAASGTVSLSPNQTNYATGSPVQVTATPAVGYVFSSFSGGITSTSNPSSLVVNGNTSITANFVTAPCTLTINIVGQGTVTPVSGGSYTCGTQIPITATPAQGYSFGQFSGALTGTTNPQTLTLNTSSTVTATFVQGTSCTLSTSTTGSGTISVSPAGTVFSCGTSLTITANPAQYYSLTSFGGALSGTTNPQTFTINADSTISAAFAQTTFPITTTVVGPGTVTANPADTGSGYSPGTQVTLTATPNSGAFFNGFSGAVSGTTNPATTTVNAAESVTATFSNAVITKDFVSHAATTTTSANTLSWQHTLGSGVNSALVIEVGEASTGASPDPASVVTSVTFNGVYATPVPNSVINGGTSSSEQTQLFYLLASELPAPGTYTVQVNTAGSVTGISAGAISFFGINQGPPDAVSTNRNDAGGSTITNTITTLTGNDVIVDVTEGGTITTFTPNTGQTLAWSAAAKTGQGAASTESVATPGVVNLGWTATNNRIMESDAAFAPATATVPATYALTTSVAGGVGGTVSTNPGLASYPMSTGVLLTATAQTGYTFSGWTGDYTSSANPLPITMDTNRNVVANFSSAPTCTVNFTIVGNGTLNTSSGTYNCGTVLQLVATAGSGYTFTSYSGDFNSTDNPAYFTLSANSNITAEFDPIPTCSLTVTTVGQGTVSPGTGSYTCGSTLSLQATAANGYAFSGYTGDVSSTANPLTVTLSQNMNITANFVQGSSCTLTTSVTGQGTITPSSGSYACGTVINIQAVPAAHYLFNGWGGALSGSVTPTALTMSSNETVTAAFVVNTAGVTGDPRTITEPVYPSVCTVLTAVQSVTSPVETSPDTARVQSALNACPSGQAVEFSPSADGTANAFLIQPITLPAGVTMLVDPEVTILGSINSADYACISSQSWCVPLIDVAANTAPAQGSAIMGLGVIDGRGGTPLTDKGKSWWATGSDARPRLVFLSSHSNTAPADNFTMYKITLKNSPKFEFSGIGNNLIIWGVKIYAPPDSPNTDGIDPSGSQNISIVNSYISDGDDMIAMKAGNGHVANVTIANNHMYSGHGITVGSETNAGLNNMYVHDNAIDNGFGGSSVDSLRIKSDTSRGGEVYDVLYKNICINHGGDTIVIDPYYSSETGSLIPNFHDITFSNVHELIRDSSHKPTMAGYNTNGIINPLTVTLDNFAFDGAVANDFKAPDNFNNVQFTFGPGPVNVASFLTADAAVASNLITVTNSVSNSNPSFSCTNAFVYLVGDLTAKSATATSGGNATLTAVLQNVVSPLVAGTISYPQQNAPSGTINILEGSTVVGTGTISGRVTHINLTGLATGTHTYTAQYSGDNNYAGLSFGSFTLTVGSPAPTANNQTITVNYNTATPITLTASGSGTITYSIVTNPTHGTLSGSIPALTYTPTSGYSGADSFTFKANNGTDSNIATVTINVSASAQTSQTITFSPPASPVTYGASAITLNATASSNLPVSYSFTGPASLSGNQLSFTGQGSVVITASQTGNSTYSSATPVQQSITVNPATLNVSVTGSPSRYFGQPNPSFTYAITGFVNNDSSTAVSGLPLISTSAVPKSPSGSYVISVAAGTLSASNYLFNLINGTLTVTGGSAQGILFAPLANYSNGTSVPLAAIASSGLAVTFSVTNGPATISNGNILNIQGTGAIQVTATQLGDSNFNAATPVVRTFSAQ